MADAILSLFLDQVKTIIDKAKKEVKLLVGVEEEVEKLERYLDVVLRVFAHAEEKKTTDELVKKWLDRLKEAVYDMEDALWKSGVELEVKGAENGANRQGRLSFPKRPETSTFVDVSKLCGRNGGEERTIEVFVGRNSEDEAGKLIQTISIVGLGGLGKTALVQLVGNDPDVKMHFESVIWVCVSDSFNEKRVAKAIIQGLEKLSGSAAYGLESDPMEADEGETWDSLKVTFDLGAAGSRILVTTGDIRIASFMGSSNSQIIHLEKLVDEECGQYSEI
ncbi:hypothetical protein SLEP1_g35813 [Rubroshorea leprosula]|uniref:Uncharacterized protein n=1 Tax=Rubroshorea leprosula TaxID=152421 RepID=A0AAV5KPD4_9ROSI|nr:hypothetical protein SLEP1_g35813 [Rubroshorea leprosula]